MTSVRFAVLALWLGVLPAVAQTPEAPPTAAPAAERATPRPKAAAPAPERAAEDKPRPPKDAAPPAPLAKDAAPPAPLAKDAAPPAPDLADEDRPRLGVDGAPAPLPERAPEDRPRLSDDDGPGGTRPPELGEESLGWMLLRTLLVLGIVVGSIYLTLNYGLRKLMGLKGPVGSASLISVMERVPLDQRRALFVIKAANEYLLVGSSEGSLSLLSKLNTEEVERLQKERAATSMSMSPFLQKLLSRRGPPPSA